MEFRPWRLVWTDPSGGCYDAWCGAGTKKENVGFIAKRKGYYFWTTFKTKTFQKPRQSGHTTTLEEAKQKIWDNI